MKMGLIFIGVELCVLAIGLLLSRFLLTEPRHLMPQLNSDVWMKALLWSILPAGLAAAMALTSFGPFLAVQELFKNGRGRELIQSNLILVALGCLLAGGSEELLFRGVLQTRWGLVIASLVFGVLHATSPVHFVIASLLGVYFGFAFQRSGNNLFVPAVAHAICDFTFMLLFRLALPLAPSEIVK
ncbi:MAG: CPBP family intramembrane metalloprotease [Elusimicrobia bacterium]|nr:CPBP family intramembrane metalloprotease [Elusimicrobiota bacterium]